MDHEVPQVQLQLLQDLVKETRWVITGDTQGPISENESMLAHAVFGKLIDLHNKALRTRIQKEIDERMPKPESNTAGFDPMAVRGQSSGLNSARHTPSPEVMNLIFQMHSGEL